MSIRAGAEDHIEWIKLMKNVMLIDEAPNCAYDIFEIEDRIFDLIFPQKDQNIEFLEDVLSRCDQSEIDIIFSNFNKNPKIKSLIIGIHGILFSELKNQKSKFYPNKRDSDLDGWGRNWISDPSQPPINTPEFMANLFKDEE